MAKMSSDANSEKAAKSKALNRRQFMSDAAKAAGGVCAGSLLLSLYAKSAESKPAHALRPPGALEEEEFLSARVRRSLCVRACPSSPSHVCAAGFLRT
jgi:ferredoxin-type protein NapG